MCASLHACVKSSDSYLSNITLHIVLSDFLQTQRINTLLTLSEYVICMKIGRISIYVDLISVSEMYVLEKTVKKQFFIYQTRYQGSHALKLCPNFLSILPSVFKRKYFVGSSLMVHELEDGFMQLLMTECLEKSGFGLRA